ncbi:histone deacetylase [Methylobacterium sp. Leaf456]|uniref:histone deacetylase family protein n=1 Tax=Methylobacterium sp. Leaf456 TaxID=1736382 RepID=UPI0006F6F077|nr:histone deacetylase [Methylobacterium sp. Leaf456]KQT46762.1 histone deacetylase [Methylobacterium sp. Leaf456]
MLPIVFHPAYEAALPEGHRFPMRKYGRLAEVLLARGLVPDGFVTPEPADAALLSGAHDFAYVEAVLTGQVPRAVERAIGLPVTESVVARSHASSGGTLCAARLALDHGLAGSTAGGSHHARRAGGAGFCVFNDVAVAALALKREGRIRRALIVDLDVHQGDGTADCLAREPDLFTLSVHCERNYPTDKVPGDLDIGLPDGLGDADYLAVLEARLPPLVEGFAPDLIFYNAGVDPHRDDRLGRLDLTDEGLSARDRFVVGLAKSKRVPLCTVVGGGYGSDVDAIAARHALVFEAMAGV